MKTYTYSLSADFPGGVCRPEDLHKEVEAAIATALQGVHINGDVVELVFADALSAAEKTSLDGDTTAPCKGLIAANYDLAKVKKLKIAKLSADVNAYVYAHYEPHRQASFNALMIEASHENLLNRYAYIKSGLTWVKMVIARYYLLEYTINAQTTKEAVEAVTYDLPALFDAGAPVDVPNNTGPDPVITLGAASQIPN